jgi:hypothetical protein
MTKRAHFDEASNTTAEAVDWDRTSPFCAQPGFTETRSQKRARLEDEAMFEADDPQLVALTKANTKANILIMKHDKNHSERDCVSILKVKYSPHFSVKDTIGTSTEK